MPSVIKVDQIQSDTGNVAISGNVSSTLTVSNTGFPLIVRSGGTNHITMFDTRSSTGVGTMIGANQDGNTYYDSNYNATATAGGHIWRNGGSDILTLGATGLLTTTAGIKFPGTQVSSADANTLDDYEEGRWDITITYDGSASGVTYTSRNGYYTKVGRVVTVHGVLNLSNKGTGSGSVRISLPFQSIAERGGLSCGNTQSLTGTNAARELMIEGGTSFFNVRYPSGTGSTTEISYTDIANNFYIVFGGCYMTT